MFLLTAFTSLSTRCILAATSIMFIYLFPAFQVDSSLIFCLTNATLNQQNISMNDRCFAGECISFSTSLVDYFSGIFLCSFLPRPFPGGNGRGQYAAIKVQVQVRRMTKNLCNINNHYIVGEVALSK